MEKIKKLERMLSDLFACGVVTPQKRPEGDNEVVADKAGNITKVFVRFPDGDIEAHRENLRKLRGRGKATMGTIGFEADEEGMPAAVWHAECVKDHSTGDTLSTEDGDNLTTEDGDNILLE